MKKALSICNMMASETKKNENSAVANENKKILAQRDQAWIVAAAVGASVPFFNVELLMGFLIQYLSSVTINTQLHITKRFFRL